MLSENDYAWMSASALAAGIRERNFSAREVIGAALARIDRLNPGLHAFIDVHHERARAQAHVLDTRIARGEPVGVLSGVPIALKDNLCLKDTRTTCASKILESYIPPYTATAVQKLLDADAIVVGKTNLDEFAMGSSCENSAFGITRNPWDLQRVPGGSSGGSAVAVAAGMVPLALGSDTGGSIRQPAAHTGTVGLKPTYGRVSRYGLIAYASSLDQIGPFARNVRDAALLQSVIEGHDPLDATSAKTVRLQSKPNRIDALKGLRLGIPKEYFIEGIDPEVRHAVESAIRMLKAAGVETVECSLPHTPYGIAVYYIVATAEASSNLARFDGMHYGHRSPTATNLLQAYARSRAEGFGAEVKRRIMLGTYVLSKGYYDAFYLKAQKVRQLIRSDFDRVWEKCDLLVSPTSPTAAFKMGEKTADPLAMYLSDIFTISANLAALPALSLPCGATASGLPIGLQLFAKPFDEERLLQVAETTEGLLQWVAHPTL